MIHLLVALMLAPAQNNLGTIRMHVQDASSQATAVIDKDMRPVRPPDCRTDAEVQHAVWQVRNGQQGDCWVRDVTAFNRH